MKKYHFNKLVRNKLPERFTQEGISFAQSKLTDDQFALELKNKLLEEVLEVKDADSREDLIKELADVMEVVEAIKVAYSISSKDIEEERVVKSNLNGHFSAENFIHYIEVPKTKNEIIEYLENKNRI